MIQIPEEARPAAVLMPLSLRSEYNRLLWLFCASLVDDAGSHQSAEGRGLWRPKAAPSEWPLWMCVCLPVPPPASPLTQTSQVALRLIRSQNAVYLDTFPSPMLRILDHFMWWLCPWEVWWDPVLCAVCSAAVVLFVRFVYNGSYALNGSVISSWTLGRCRLLLSLHSNRGLAMSHMSKKCIFLLMWWTASHLLTFHWNHDVNSGPKESPESIKEKFYISEIMTNAEEFKLCAAHSKRQTDRFFTSLFIW